MHHLPLTELKASDQDFEVVHTTEQSQLAIMVLQPGEDSGEYGNEHSQSDQTMIVLEGQAEATINGNEVTIEQGGSVLIKAGEDHQIRNKAATPLRTVNVYAPPAYDDKGEPI